MSATGAGREAGSRSGSAAISGLGPSGRHRGSEWAAAVGRAGAAEDGRPGERAGAAEVGRADDRPHALWGDDEVVPPSAFPRTDTQCATFARSLGLRGYLDVHVHVLPAKLQDAVWGYFDQLQDPPWPITYRDDEDTRLATLRALGVVAHTALAYGHRPGVAAWCNQHTLGLAQRAQQVIPTFTFFPEDGVDAEVDAALARGGRIAKVHLQVGRFHATDPRLDGVWSRLATERIPTVMHASAVYGVDGGDGFCGPDAVRALLDRHPDLLVVVAHLGMPDAAGFLALAEEVTSLRLDTTMVLTDPPYAGEYPAELLPRLASIADRVLFGSDFPSIPHHYAAQIRGLAALGLTTSALRGLFHDNAARLLGLSAAG